MTVIGYARVSTRDQDLSIQEAALRAAGWDWNKHRRPVQSCLP
jgi:DNA invertase Pin-like site-specific DNA recombinase